MAGEHGQQNQPANDVLPVDQTSKPFTADELDILVAYTGTSQVPDYGWRIEVFKDNGGRLYYGYRKGSGKARKYQYGGTFAKLVNHDEARTRAYTQNRERRAAARSVRSGNP